VSQINRADRDALYERLLKVAKRKTKQADMQLDDRGRPIEAGQDEFGDNVLIVPQTEPAPAPAGEEAE